MEDQNENPIPPSEKGNDIALYVTDIFQEFKNARLPYEAKAEEWWNNFLSQYQSSKNWRNKEGEGDRSRIFIKLTQQKCYTAHAKVMDALGADVPFEMEALENLDYGNVPRELLEKAAQYRKTYISDYFKYIKFFDTIDDATLDATIFPAAIIKGPIMTVERQPVMKRRMIGGIPAEQLDPANAPFYLTTESVEKYVCETVPFWDYYVDVNATKTRKSIGEIHYKRLLPQEFRDLKDDPGYNPAMMAEAIQQIDTLKTSIADEDDKTMLQLGDKYMGTEAIKDNKIPVLEFHGLVRAKMLRDYGATVPEGIGDDEDVEALVAVVLAGKNIVIKATYNYLGYRPFMVFGVKKIPNSVYCHSTAGLIDDSQAMINSGARLFVDNKALSGNGCVAVHDDKINWTKTKNAQIYPRKTFYLKGNATVKEAIDSITFPDVTMGIKDMIQMFMQLADEESGIPKYSQGDMSGGNFLNKTATGISMIMGAANVNLKPFLKNIDDQVLEPAIERYDALFSMLGKYPPEFNIPLKVVATGTISLMARELIVENMIKLLQITQNPQDAMIIRRREILKAMADKLGLSKFVKSEQEIQQIEQMMAQRQAEQPLQTKGEVDVDKLFPMLTPVEQAQVLQSVGLQPDPRRMQMPAQPQPTQGAA